MGKDRVQPNVYMLQLWPYLLPRDSPNFCAHHAGTIARLLLDIPLPVCPATTFQLYVSPSSHRPTPRDDDTLLLYTIQCPRRSTFPSFPSSILGRDLPRAIAFTNPRAAFPRPRAAQAHSISTSIPNRRGAWWEPPEAEFLADTVSSICRYPFYTSL